MRIAFYAPMKSPTSARPSGDRRIARLFMAALERAGLDVELASTFRAWEGGGDLSRQEDIADQGARIALELVAEYRQRPSTERPVAWFSYHLYHKAPDWIGPAVCASLGIPYFLAEASIATRQRDGAWAAGYRSSVDAVKISEAIFTLNPVDVDGLRGVPGCAAKVIQIKPFLDRPGRHTRDRISMRQLLAQRHKLDPDRYWLLCVAMMRDDSKLVSYRQLAAAVEKLRRKDWQLIVVGDGAAETMVRELFRFDFDRRVHFIGRKDEPRIYELMHACDLFVWPAVNEAIGMVALEALSCGLPAVCGRAGGIDHIVEHGGTGLLVDDPAEPEAALEFANAIESLLDHPERLAAMSDACLRKYSNNHQLCTAADVLRKTILPRVHESR